MKVIVRQPNQQEAEFQVGVAQDVPGTGPAATDDGNYSGNTQQERDRRGS